MLNLSQGLSQRRQACYSSDPRFGGSVLCLSYQVHSNPLYFVIVSFLIVKVNVLILPGGSYIIEIGCCQLTMTGVKAISPQSSSRDQYREDDMYATLKFT